MTEKPSSASDISTSTHMPLTVRQQAYMSRFPKIDAAKIGEYRGRGQQYTVYEYGDSRVLKIPHLRWWYPNATADEQKRDLDFLNDRFPEYSLPSSIHVTGRGGAYCVLQKRIAGSNLTPIEDVDVTRDFEEIIERNRKMIRDDGISLDFFGLDGIKSCFRSFINPVILPELSNLVVTDSRQVSRQTAEELLIGQLARPTPESIKETIYGPAPDESISTAVRDWLDKAPAHLLTPETSRIAIPDFTILRLRNGPESDLRRIMYRIAFKANRVLMKKFWGVDIA
jgi:hypothetical protein